MIEQDGAAGLEWVFVNEWQDADVVFAADRRWHNGVVIVNDLLQCADRHGCPSQVIHLRSLFLLVNDNAEVSYYTEHKRCTKNK